MNTTASQTAANAFVPLSVHSYYSLMWGTHSPEQICRKAKQMGYTRLALTDTNNLYGLWPFLNSCRYEGITPIIGAEITCLNSVRRVICLAENHAGYQNLCRLITRRHCDAEFDLTPALIAHGAGVITLASSPDILADLHTSGNSVFAMVPRKPNSAAFHLRKTAQPLNIPIVAVPDSFFMSPADIHIHRMLRAIDRNTSLSRLPHHDTAHSDAWFAPAAVYNDRFAIWPDVITATRELADRITFTGPSHGLVMPPWTTEDQSPEQTLRTAAYTGARKRYGHDLPETVVNRLEHELQIIADMGFASYFLVVRSIVSQSPRICGRGSGAASLVAYCLGITNVCPVKHNLYFERFLNPGRPDPPDIDVDFAWDERDTILDYVLSTYAGHAAMVCNHVAFKPRMAIREVAKVYGLTDQEIGQVSKRLPWFWRMEFTDDDLLTHLKQLPELRQLDFPHPWPEIIGLAQRIIGLPRHISVHSGGVVITPEPIDTYVPVEMAPKGVPIVQWEKDGTEESGLVKIDLLGNRSLGVIRDALFNIAENGTIFDETKWIPEDDPATQQNIAQGNTMGCFYIESPATRMLQKKAGVGDFEHLVIHSSIIRPAANDFIREYVRRLHGQPWDPIHPLLAHVLNETYGIMVYQEDVSKTAVALAGFSHAEADGLRKIMSKKDKHRQLSDYYDRFVTGARRRGVTDRQITQIWEMMMSFSGYSFCKPHSASYAKVSFQAAYLKTHFPAEFMAAVISNQGGFYSTFAYVSEAQRMGITILPPDVNHSAIRWYGHDRTIRVGLLTIKHLSQITRQRIIEGRQIKPYKNIGDFLLRVRLDDTEARALIHTGAFDSLHPAENRAALLWELTRWQKKHATNTAQLELFQLHESVVKPEFPAEPEHQRQRSTFFYLGFLYDTHPMRLYRPLIEHHNIIRANAINHHRGQHIRFAGLLITGKTVMTKHGDPMKFFTFEDETGLVETTFFPKAYRRFCAIIDRSRPFILHGRVEEDFGAVMLNVNQVEILKDKK